MRVPETLRVDHTYFMFDYNQLGQKAEKPISEKESKDLLGQKSLLYFKYGTKTSFQGSMILSNYSLASNKGLKKIPKSYMVSKDSELPGAWTSYPVGHLVNPDKSDIHGYSVFIQQGPTLRAIFLESLPDITTEFSAALKEKKYAKLPSAAITAVFNTLLNAIHIPLLAIQALAQLISFPTWITGYFVNKYQNSESYKKAGFAVLGALAAIITLPFQLGSILANTIEYSRHVIDGVVTVAKEPVKLIANAGMLILSTLPLLGGGLVNLSLRLANVFLPKNRQVQLNHPADSFKEAFNNLKKDSKDSMSQGWYAVKDTAKFTYKLLPIAAVAAIAYFSGGLSLLLSPIATAAGATGALGLSAVSLSTATIATAIGAGVAIVAGSQIISNLGISLKNIASKVYDNFKASFKSKSVGKGGESENYKKIPLDAHSPDYLMKNEFKHSANSAEAKEPLSQAARQRSVARPEIKGLNDDANGARPGKSK